MIKRTDETGQIRPEYVIWQQMNYRCHSVGHPDFVKYGARGIVVCEQWRGKGGFPRFMDEVGLRPTRYHSIDRANNDGNYEPGNVRWVTMDVQIANRRNNRRVTYKGEEMTLRKLTKKFGLNQLEHRRVYARVVQLGWDAETAVTVPFRAWCIADYESKDSGEMVKA